MTEIQRENLIDFIDTLRRTGKRQTDGQLKDERTGAVCALGLAMEQYGISPNEYEELDKDEWREKFGTALSQKTIVRLNDDESMTFAEIADYIEYFYLKNNKNDNDC